MNVVVLFNEQKGITLELHWKILSENYAINIEKINIFEQSYFIEIDEYKIKMLNLEFLLIYLCIHGSKHFFERISWINDIHLLISTKNIDWGKVLFYAKKLQVERIVYTAIYIVFFIFETNIPKDLKYFMSKDKKSKLIALKILKLENKGEKLTYKSFKILLDQRIRILKKIELILKLLFYPKETDLINFNMPKYMKSIFIIIRPFRLLIKYLRKN